MKQFFYFSFIMLCLAACKTPKPKVEMPFSIEIMKNGSQISLVNNDTIVIEEFEVNGDGDAQFSFGGPIFPDEEFIMEVNTTRNQFAVANQTFDELCIINCESAQSYDEDGENVFPVSKNFSAQILGEQKFYTHCSPSVAGDHIITYDFHKLGNPKANIKATVIYRYNP